MIAPARLLELIERFREQRESYTSGRYKEAQLRQEFLNPFIALLGWDVDNSQGYAEAYKEVVHEDSLRTLSGTKAPDYALRIGGVTKYFIEAKEPSVNLRNDPASAYQLRRYAWNAKLPLSILTDFEEFAVYDCRIKPEEDDRASVGRVMYLRLEEYPDRWDDIQGVFSREAILHGSFDRYAESSRRKRGTAEVDAAFLEEVARWRKLLASNVAVRNQDLNEDDLNFVVQRTIDRIIFLRICEDRGIEQYGRLQAAADAGDIYEQLTGLFRAADDRYNSGLFHFREERDRNEPPDTLTLGVVIADGPLKQIIRALYYPASPYEFSVMPPEILGHVYEQLLGAVVRLTARRRVQVEEKPEVRRAGGVYYTPSWVVDYIVRQTLGLSLQGRPVRGRGSTEPLRILDPSCGSGSFLLAAYQHLLDWHREAYLRDGAARHGTRIVQTGPNAWCLTTPEKKRILLAHIFGTDVDAQAVEVTKLSLLLKVLEGESQQSIDRQFQLLHTRALPDLANNIKCGNTLIEPDFHVEEQQEMFGDRPRRVNAFNWQGEFGEILRGGGFDVIIGNPPWGAEFSEPELGYLRRKYARVVSRMVDSYIYFMDAAVRLAKPTAPIGFVLPATLLNQTDARPARQLYLDRGLLTLVNLGQGVFGSRVLNTSAIVISAPSSSNNVMLKNLASVPVGERRVELEAAIPSPRAAWEEIVRRDPGRTYFVGDLAATQLLDRLRRSHLSLGQVLEAPIERGVTPDVIAAHVVSREEASILRLEPEALRPSISGGRIKRYGAPESDRLIIYTTRDTDIRRYPNVRARLQKFRSENSCPEVENGRHPWYALHRPRDPRLFSSPKVIGLTTVKTIELVYDESGSLVVTDAMYVFRFQPEYSTLAGMAIMQSDAFLALYRIANQGESRVIPQVKAAKLHGLPMPRLRVGSPEVQKLEQLMGRCMELERERARSRSGHSRTQLERQLHALEQEVGLGVVSLYGMSAAERSVVEQILRTAPPEAQVANGH